MKKSHIHVIILALGLAGAVPAAMAEPVASDDLPRFLGTNLYGAHWVNLGVVAEVDTKRGDVAIVGRHGELATVGGSILVRTGKRLRAPTLTAADIAAASASGASAVPITRGSVTVTE